MTLNRRQLLQTAVSTAALARMGGAGWYSAGSAAKDKLRVAGIGIGGRGRSDLAAMGSHDAFQLTALCDTDRQYFGIADQFSAQPKTFQDYRQLFADAADDFDAVLIATPDHMHSPIAMLALEHDKHVFLQKPLAQDIGECRRLAEAASQKPELATQMGIQIHAHAAYRTAVKWIQSGVISTITEVHSWSGKGWGGAQPKKQPTPVPESLDWDLYVGVSPFRDYIDGYYHRNNWRKWFAFGTGTQGDMGCHIVDPVFSALEITQPQTVKSLGPKPPSTENYALNSHIEYTFKGTSHTSDALKMSWYNGDLRPQSLSGLPAEFKLPGQGSLFVGAKGSLVLPHIGKPIVFDTSGAPMTTLPEEVGHANHFHEWINMATGKAEKTGAPFDYSGPLTEAVLLGTVINRWPGQEFQWDAKQCRFTGDSKEVQQANKLLAPKYRTGW